MMKSPIGCQMENTSLCAEKSPNSKQCLGIIRCRICFLIDKGIVGDKPSVFSLLFDAGITAFGIFVLVTTFQEKINAEKLYD